MFDEPKDKKLRVLLDSDSLKSDSAKRLLQYNDNDLFEFVSLGNSTKHTVAELNFEGESSATGIVIDKSGNHFRGYKSSVWFGYNLSDIQIEAIKAGKGCRAYAETLAEAWVKDSQAKARLDAMILTTTARWAFRSLSSTSTTPK